MPSQYVVSQLIFTYEYGFIPRGLIGSAIKLLFGNYLYHYTTLAIIILSVGILFMLWIGYNAYLSCFKHDNVVMTILLLWFSISMYPAYYAHTMGYFEQYAYIIVIIFIEISLRSKWNTILITGGVFSIIVLLISETNAFLVCPVLVAITLMSMFRSNRGENFHIKKALSILAVYVPSGIYCIATQIIKLPEDRLMRLVQQAEMNAPNLDYFSRRYNLINYFLDRIGNWEARIRPIPTQMILFTLLIVIFVVACIFLTKKIHQHILIIYIISAIAINICGYAAIFVGADVYRFYFCMSMATLLLSIYVFRAFKFNLTPQSSALIIIFGTLAVISTGTYHIPLFDHAQYNFFIYEFLRFIRRSMLNFIG